MCEVSSVAKSCTTDYHLLTLRSPMVSFRSFSENVTRSVAMHRHSSWWRSCFKRYANSFCVSLKSYHENKADCNSDTLILNLQRKQCRYFLILHKIDNLGTSKKSSIYLSCSDASCVSMLSSSSLNLPMRTRGFDLAYSWILPCIPTSLPLCCTSSTFPVYRHNRNLTYTILHIKRITTSVKLFTFVIIKLCLKFEIK